MDWTTTYREGRQRLIALGRDLGKEQAGMTVAATPEWTVKDNYAHLSGACADVLAGNLEGVATDPWTAAQVEARRHMALGEILDEWESNGEAMDALVASLGDAVDPRLPIDEWTHEQDVRGTLGVPGGTDEPVVPWGGQFTASTWVRRVAKKQLAPLRVVCDGTEHLSHATDTGPTSADDPVPTLTIDGFTALRVLVGRRSESQMADLDWSGTADPTPWFDALVMFSIAAQDIHDAR